MTYARSGALHGGLGHGYIGRLGDDLVIDWSHADSSVQALQRELQRLGFLESGAGVFGADGKWGPRTEHALIMAAHYVQWSGEPFTAHYDNAQRDRGSVTVPAELIARLRSAAPAPSGSINPSAQPAQPAEERIVIGPELDPPESERGSTEPLPWWPWLLIGGGVLLMGGAGMWLMRKSPRRSSVPTRRSQMTTVHANRRRRKS